MKREGLAAKAHAAYMREYTLKNREKINAQRRTRRTDATLTREKAWRSDNPDRVRKYKRTDREKRPEDYRRWGQEYRARNSERLKERKRRDYAENKNKIQARLDKFRMDNPAKWRKTKAEAAARRRARLANAFVENVNRDVIYERDGGICQLCRRSVIREDLSLDHIVPIVHGGLHCYLNIQLTHVNCNKARGHRGPAQMRLVP